MSGPLIGAVLFAAVLHAGWNAIAKWIPDRLVASALIGVAFAAGGAVGALVLPMPSVAAWPFVIASSVLQVGYMLLLTSAYSHGEFGRVYPLARGLSPVLVTMVAVTVLGEQLSVAELFGVALLCSALGALVLIKGLPRRGDGLGLAVLTGVTIAAYTVVDGIGVTRTDNPLSYAAWLFLLQGIALVLACRMLSGPAVSAAGLIARMREHLRLGLLGGLLSLIAYAIVLWAQSFGNLALVSALRKTSVLFAGIIAVVLFKERQTRVQVLALVLAVAGVVLVKAA
jgi:uncharacterized membrane protein